MEFPLLLYRGEHFNANFTYLSGLDIDHCFLLIKKKSKLLFVPQLHAELAKKCFNGKVIVYSIACESLKKHLRKTKIYADLSSLPSNIYLKLSKFCKLVNYSEVLYKIRMKKSKQEVAKLAKAAKITRELIHSLNIPENLTENQVKSQLLKNMLDLGFEPSFEPIVLSGSNTRFPHAKSSDKKIKDLVLIDCGIRYQNYCGDLTRCICLKQDKKIKKDYEALQAVCGSIVDNLPDLETSNKLALFAKKQMKKQKLPKLIHAIGHGVGLDIHEYPRLRSKYKENLKDTVFTIEPGVYTKKYGLRFEEMIYFNGKKARIL